MPNWCMNSIYLRGPKDVIEELAAAELSLEKLVPVPLDIKEVEKRWPIPKGEEGLRKDLKAKYGVDTAYDWQVKNWGTKWDLVLNDKIRVEKETDDTYSIDIGFDSAWSPPVTAFETIYERYKERGLEIHLEYFEPGVCFLGVMTAKDGYVGDDCCEYTNADELAKAVTQLNHSLAESEVEYLREQEAEENSNQIEEETKSLGENNVNDMKNEPTNKKKPTAKKVATKKPAPKKAVAKKAASKKPVAKKVAAKKVAPKKAVAKKVAPKKAVAKKPTPKKPVAKKAVAKKPVAKKAAVKKPAPKKVAAKKPAPKKPTAKR